MSKDITFVGGRIKSAADNDPYIAEAKDIIDENLQENQESINNNTYRKDDVYNKEQVNNIVSRTPETDVVVLNVGGSTIVGDIFPHDAEDWEMGSLDGDTELESTSRCRTDFIDIEGATKLEVTRLNTTLPMNVGWYYYNSDKHSISSSPYISSGEITPIEGAKYIRFLIKPETDGTFSMTPERAATAVSCVMTVGISLDDIPVEDRPNKLFRVPGPGNTTYSEWGWDGQNWVMLANKDYGIDNEPTEGSNNFAKSGGILNKIIEISDKSIKPVSNILRNGVKRDAILESSWENGTLDNEGQPSGNATIRLRSKNFISMSYKEIPTVVYDTNSCGISIYMYDENYTFIESTSYLSVGGVDIDEDTAYVKFLIKSNPDGSDLDPSAVDTYGIHVVCDIILEDYLTKSLIYSPFFRPLFTVDDLVDGTILDNGDEDNRKERKKNASYLPINPYHRFAIIYGNDLWELSCSYYDADRNFLGESGYYPAGIFNPVYKAAAYIRFVFRYKPNPNIEVPAGAMDKFAVSVCDMDDEGADLKATLSTLKSHVDTVTQEGGRYDIFPQNFINGTIDGEGNIVPSYIRAVSGFVKVNPNTRYALEQIEPTEKTLDCSFVLYNKNKEFITWITYRVTHTVLDTINAEYIRALLMYTPDGQDINPNQFFPLSLKAVDIKKSATGYFVPYPDSWQYGSITNEGEPGPYVPYRIRTKDFISIEGGKSYVCNYPDELYSVDICMYDENFNYIGDTLYIPNGGMTYLNDSVKYCKMIIKPNLDGSTIDIDEAVTRGISVNIADDDIEDVAELAKLNVGLWNIGLLNYGVPVDGRWGIPDDQVAEKLPGVKNIITELNGDITFICEYSNHVDRSYTIDSYDTIFKHFYPYRYIVGEPWMSVFSKYKLFVKMERNAIELIDADIYPYDLNGRPIVYGYIIVGGQKVGIMCCHLSPYSSDRRIKEATRICTLMAEYDRCIIAGDLNSDPGAEGFERDMRPFRDAGYEFANGGYWGYKNTYNPNYPPERGGGQMYIDNILTRGIVIDNYTVGNDMSVSDHLPVRSELSVFVSEE